MNRLGRGLMGLLFLASLVPACLLALAFAPTFFGYESLIVGNGSMGRAMPVGSVAVTRMVDVRAIARGDIVVFKHEGAALPMAHRVIAVEDEHGQRVFTTKGDANPSPDPIPLRFGQGQIARVGWVIPYAGYVTRWARSPVGVVALLGVPIVGLVVDRRLRR